MTEIVSNKAGNTAIQIVGQAALTHEVYGNRVIEIAGQQVETDLPPNAEDIFLPFELPVYDADGQEVLVGSRSNITWRPLIPARLDKLEARTYHAKVVADPLGERVDTQLFRERVIEVKDGPRGKVISEAALESFAIYDEVDSPKLLELLGFIFDDGELRYVPTPETVGKNAQELGVALLFFPDQAIINGKEFLEAHEDGKHPVSTLGAQLYGHDIGDDHLTARIIGGEPLTEALKVSARKGLQSDSDIDDFAERVDEYTGALNTVVRVGEFDHDEDYLTENGRQMLIDIGEQIGIGAEITNAIIAHAQENAAHFMLAVKELR